MYRGPEWNEPNAGSQVDLSVIGKLALNAEHIFVDAYDGEAYAVWSGNP